MISRKDQLFGNEFVIGHVDAAGNVTVTPAKRQISKPVIYVADPKFGATGDGVTDDTAAVKAAKLAAGFGGTMIFGAIPGKVATTYKITEEIDFDGLCWGLQIIAEGSHAQNDAYSVSILSRVNNYRGTQASVGAKVGGIIPITIPQADWNTATGRTYAEPSEIENHPI